MGVAYLKDPVTAEAASRAGASAVSSGGRARGATTELNATGPRAPWGTAPIDESHTAHFQIIHYEK
jgi:hypothetical protein